jgi:hypothetical protein
MYDACVGVIDLNVFALNDDNLLAVKGLFVRVSVHAAALT